MIARVWARFEISSKIIEPIVCLYHRFFYDMLMPLETAAVSSPELVEGGKSNALNVLAEGAASMGSTPVMLAASEEGGAQSLPSKLFKSKDDAGEVEMTNIDGNKEGGEPEKVIITATKGEATNNEALHEFEEVLGEKEADFSEDFISMAALCFVQSNVDKMLIKPAKRAQMLWAALTAQFMVFLMLACQYKEIALNFEGDYRPALATNFGLFIVKFAAMFALHLLLTPQVRNGLSIMKYANQNPEQFTPDGAFYAYWIGLNQTAISIICILVNVYLLAA